MAFVSASLVVLVVLTLLATNSIVRVKCLFKRFVFRLIMALLKPAPFTVSSVSKFGSIAVTPLRTANLVKNVVHVVTVIVAVHHVVVSVQVVAIQQPLAQMPQPQLP
jgi:hypothetical protein